MHFSLPPPSFSVAERYGLPLIADEIYQDMVFEGESKSFAQLSKNVPVLSCGGLAKRLVSLFLVCAYSHVHPCLMYGVPQREW